MSEDLAVELEERMNSEYIGSDTEAFRWKDILEHRHFRDTLELFDTIFVDEGIEAEMHVGVNAVNDVRYENFAVPRTLDLMIADSYEEFIDEVRNPFFQKMGEEDYRRPPDSNVEVGFGSYSDVFDVETGFESMDVRLPTDYSFNREVLGNFYDENDFDGVEAVITQQEYEEASNPYLGN